ncbi:hypothetical protein CEUSTIGMA_g11764.t1 [Chlamydomonas eustigma]|uniref:RING-type E3 ubiquitin transferase n=1 Tax=Chlamydomonas eustigma TaxID=1157962 RepID=A0A250XN52_9CHLO|nr:hypothetical protein CEUSTIGMA_g11764.t1 [Chlamydomonas eustigma]|eukprot:GAX84342.1 hypothetical protein CEUSTIGMA_g11764.t1 [Chlamydomonas eustigma]
MQTSSSPNTPLLSQQSQFITPDMPPHNSEVGCCTSFFNFFGAGDTTDRAPEQHRQVEAQSYQAPVPTTVFPNATVAHRSYEEATPDSEKNRLLPKLLSSAIVNCRDDVPSSTAASSQAEVSSRRSPAVSTSGISVDKVDKAQISQHRRTASHGRAGRSQTPTWGPLTSMPSGHVSGPLGQLTGDSRHRRTTSNKNLRLTKGSSAGSASEINGLGGKTLVPQDEDDDFCPTCLEAYTKENPKIWTECAHHFHMPCIFEWMERKDTCPICESKMSFPGLS